MFKTIKKAQKGFTIIELLIVIAIIAILALLVLNNFQGAQAKARDQQRTTDINNIHSKLEELYNEKNYYPAALSLTGTDGLVGMDEGSLKDPQGGQAPTEVSVAGATEADAEPYPPSDTATSNGYKYITYGCTAGQCEGYRLKAFIEKPNSTTPLPYVKKSLNN